MSLEALSNIVWHSLTGAQSKLSAGTDHIRRFAHGYSQLIGACDQDDPALQELAPFCASDEHFYVLGWSGEPPAGWQVEVDSFVDQYVWHHAMPTALDASDIVRLDASHVRRMIALTDLTRPGPFAERTIEFGEFYGVFEGDRLLAMAGQRMHAGRLREISGVCTRPDAQGRGYSKRLMNLLLRLQMSRGQVPFLHMMHDNATARGVYERMGFRHHQRLACRVVSRQPP
jgi:ribosomal protein S18 acetylase RimI-like enzyme